MDGESEIQIHPYFFVSMLTSSNFPVDTSRLVSIEGCSVYWLWLIQPIHTRSLFFLLSLRTLSLSERESSLVLVFVRSVPLLQ